ncbi:RNA-binding protein 39 [Lepeophtheirus salmonis]|uniref:RRM domain-containing protein n=2 Tax=Lepeophtheirus salmonis TaxID=72036 RepID=A0A0K2TMK8_LEPSM|nr:RNA-binding protein 39-like [Lepeophtheirus salmonis]
MGDEVDVDALLEEPYKKCIEDEGRKENGSKRRSKTRSHSKERGYRRSRSRERRKRSRSKEKRHSRSRERKRSRSKDKRRSRSRDRKRSRSREIRIKEVRRSRSRDRIRRSRSRSRSRSRKYSPRRRYSPKGEKYGRGRSPSPRARSPEVPLTPEERDARTVFIMQLSQRVRSRDIEEFFSSVGKIRDVKLIICNKTRRFKGIAYVEFRDLESIPYALGLNGQKLCGVPVIVQPSQAEKNRVGNYNESAGKPERGPMKLYIGSLHFDITEEMLRGIFEPFGKIMSIQLMMDTDTGRSKGYGFLTYAEAEDAKKALEQMNGFELAGRPIKVGTVNERPAEVSVGPKGLDDLDRSGIDLGATGRLALMAKLAEGTGMKLPQAANQALQAPVVHHPTVPPHVQQQNMQIQQQAAASALGAPPIATQCFMLSNMFDPATETAPNWVEEVRDDVIDECNKHGGILHIYVDRVAPQGNVYVKCPSIATAVAAVNALHGRWFAGKVITAAYVPLVNYHNLFPDSIPPGPILTTRR